MLTKDPGRTIGDALVECMCPWRQVKESKFPHDSVRHGAVIIDFPILDTFHYSKIILPNLHMVEGMACEFIVSSHSISMTPGVLEDAFQGSGRRRMRRIFL